ncbi:MAG TPA: sugar phosphate isomerase/epimerase [Candidatus Hydrogenedentes bacterium]|jgi:sugar phosphate isomerase/epimerase|nr:MAG: Xylose isomerase-like TIM barrel [Candidatus Hydrogenedentes bacterium ADurb.Bin170]HNZ47274.1 sugar phosphate isomerase/epimerase [Candidatus Hydrogenedentota bacterium]HOD95673.1 sugar phosphate isomerase/epimerase [Candidatus Hydrogenedentota bacterium]HOR50634.1 sugar phosphate isomerase/epimerase [Candidatus Hydrogenedentota bacterium]HPK23714.1 sugar phosphate isomerase/epimerase [Candidatus Hydrogenedentota bacterium]
MKHESGWKMTRREALAVFGALAASAKMSGTFAHEVSAFKGIALQMYTLREPAKKDLPGTLKKVRDMGWEYIQWSGMPDLPASEIRAALDNAGLTAVSCHIGIEAFETDFDGQVAFWRTVGNSDLAPGGMMSDCRKDLEAWLRGAARLDAVAARLKETGMRLSYHNHDWEFEKFDNDPRAKIDILMEATSDLCAELDLAWVFLGGADPADYIKKFKNRCPMIHAKDCLETRKLGRRAQFVPLGQGALNWQAIFEAGKEAGVEWYIYEQDNAEKDIFECAQESFDFLKKSLSL